MKRRDRKGPQTVRRRPAPAAEGRLDGCGGLRDYGVGSEWKLPEQGGHHDALSFHRNGIVSSSAHHRSILFPCLSRRLSTRLQSLRGGRDVSLQLDLLLPLHRRAFSGAHSLPLPSSLILGFKVAPDCFEKLAKYCDPQFTMNLQYIDLRNFGLGDDGLLLICELINHYFLPNVITLLLDSFLSSLCFDSRQ